MKNTVLTLIMTVLLGFGASAQDAKSIMQKSYTANKMAGTEALAQMKITSNKGLVLRRSIMIYTKLFDQGLTEKTIFRFMAPGDVKGIGLLTFDYSTKNDEVSLYLPALRKTRRITGSETAKSFVGSEFSFADMVTPNLDDFTYKTLKDTDKAGNVDCWNIEVMAKDDGVAKVCGYSKRVVWVGKKDNVAHKTDVYDPSGKLLKTITVKAVQEVDTQNHLWKATDVLVTNVQNGKQTELKMEKIALKPNIKDHFFTTAFLEK